MKNFKTTLTNIPRSVLNVQFSPQTSLIEAGVSSQESERSICVLGVSTLPLSTTLIYDFNFDKGNNKITELRTIFQRESQNS